MVDPAAPESVPHSPDTRSDTRTPKEDRIPLPSGPALPAIPGYEIVGELGRGGMGVVYRARQVGLNRVVALKMIRAAEYAGPGVAARFRREAEAVARLRHPNIVTVYEVGEHQGQPYFSMELVEGGGLDRGSASQPQPARDAARLVETLAHAIHVVHQCGIVHRDLKPANVLLTADGVPKIADFGLAKQVDESARHTPSGAVLGTPQYMAPEQAAGKGTEVGAAADVYALGALLYALLTGRPPFHGSNPVEVVTAVLFDDPVPPSRWQPEVPRDLETVCLKCLDKSPGRRYATAAALADDLRRFLLDEPIRARSVGPAERVAKWARRRPAAAALLAVSGVSILALLGLSLGFNAYLRQQVEAARRGEQQALEGQRLAVARVEGQELLRQGREAARANDWPTARVLLARARERVGADPALGDLQGDVGRSLGEAEDRVKGAEDLGRFRRLRNDALFHGTLLTGLGVDSDARATKEGAEKALALFGVGAEPDGGAVAPALPSFFTAADQAEVREGCYELLLLLADVRANPPAGQAPGERAGRAREALRLLDRAAGLLPGPPTQAAALRRARYLAAAGDGPGAEDAARQAREARAVSALDHYLVGDERYRRGDLAQAAREFEQALQVRPDDFWSQYFLAICHLKARRLPEAKASLNACLSLDPGNVWVHLLRGFAHGELGEFEAAEDDFGRAAALAEADEFARYGIHVNRGVMRVRQGRLEEAVAEFDRAIAVKPDAYQAYVNQAEAYQQLKQLSEAVARLDRAISLEPGMPALYRLRAQLYLQREDPDAALRDLDQAIRSGEGRGPAAALAQDHFERGRILHHGKRYGEAVAAYEAALRARPDHAAALRLDGEALLELKRYQEAVAAFTACLKAGEPAAAVYRSRGLALARLGRYRDAVADYSRAVAEEPDAATYAARGWLYLANESPVLALADFEDALRASPENAEAFAGRGCARVTLGQLREGVADAEEAVRRAPAAPAVLHGAARVYAQALARMDAAADGRKPVQPGQRAECQERALELLRRALEATPAADRREFWERSIQQDAAWEPVRSSTGFIRLQTQYARPGG
jgi:tetratricopeptide (TPR) repeat protein